MCRLGGADEIHCVHALPSLLRRLGAFTPSLMAASRLLCICAREVGGCLRGPDSGAFRFGRGGGGSGLYGFGHETAVQEVEGLEEERREEHVEGHEEGAVRGAQCSQRVAVGACRGEAQIGRRRLLW